MYVSVEDSNNQKQIYYRYTIESFLDKPTYFLWDYYWISVFRLSNKKLNFSYSGNMGLEQDPK